MKPEGPLYMPLSGKNSSEVVRELTAIVQDWLNAGGAAIAVPTAFAMIVSALKTRDLLKEAGRPAGNVLPFHA
jgi:hypothetical protein